MARNFGKQILLFSVVSMSGAVGLKFGNGSTKAALEFTVGEGEMIPSQSNIEKTTAVSPEMKKIAGAVLRGTLSHEQLMRQFTQRNLPEQEPLEEVLHAISDLGALFEKAREWAKNPLKGSMGNYEHGPEWESRMRDVGENYLLNRRRIMDSKQRREILDSYAEEDKLLQLIFQDSESLGPGEFKRFPYAVELRNSFEAYGYEFKAAVDYGLTRVNSALTDATPWGIFDSRRSNGLW